MSFEQKLVVPVGIANLMAWHALMHAAWTPPAEEDDAGDLMFGSLGEVELTVQHLDRAEVAMVLSYLVDYTVALSAQLDAGSATAGRWANPDGAHLGSGPAGIPAPTEAGALRAVLAGLPDSHLVSMPSLIYVIFETLVGMCTQFAALDQGSFDHAAETIKSVQTLHSEPVVVPPPYADKPTLGDLLDDPPF